MCVILNNPWDVNLLRNISLSLPRYIFVVALHVRGQELQPFPMTVALIRGPGAAVFTWVAFDQDQPTFVSCDGARKEAKHLHQSLWWGREELFGQILKNAHSTYLPSLLPVSICLKKNYFETKKLHIVTAKNSFTAWYYYKTLPKLLIRLCNADWVQVPSFQALIQCEVCQVNKNLVKL